MDRDLADELMRCDWFIEKIRSRNDYAQNVYAAFCNMRWQAADVVPILKDEHWSISWRAAGSAVAHFVGHGDYLDWYCSGIATVDDEGNIVQDFIDKKYVPEGVVTDEILEDFAALGWHPSPWPKDKD